MKNILLAVLSIIVLAQYGICADTTNYASTNILKDLKNAVVSDVTNNITTSVNNVKLAAYKVQLEQKQKELQEVEESSSIAIVKYFKKARINSKIAELEANIEALEE